MMSVVAVLPEGDRVVLTGHPGVARLAELASALRAAGGPDDEIAEAVMDAAERADDLAVDAACVEGDTLTLTLWDPDDEAARGWRGTVGDFVCCRS